MGAKCWFLLQSAEIPRTVLHGDLRLDVAATDRLAAAIGGGTPRYEGGSDLMTYSDPRLGRGAFAVIGPVQILATEAVALDRPSELEQRYLDAAAGRQTFLFAMHSVVDYGAFAWWDAAGTLKRSISASAEHGIVENIGTALPFESQLDEMAEYPDGYPVPFHPLDMVECALAEYAGFCYEGIPAADAPDPEYIPVRIYA
ncbi:MAG: hypothetical protein QM662_12060 [Gordonia sp. (in: high G+C Gram-positive bacteria)]